MYRTYVYICTHILTEILFGSLGRIKKVKIYTTPLGKQKGDALITFVLSECAITACFKVMHSVKCIYCDYVMSCCYCAVGDYGKKSWKHACRMLTIYIYPHLFTTVQRPGHRRRTRNQSGEGRVHHQVGHCQEWQ